MNSFAYMNIYFYHEAGGKGRGGLKKKYFPSQGFGQGVSAVVINHHQSNIRPLLDGLDKRTSFKGDGADHRIGGIEGLDQGLAEKGGETFHFPDLVDDDDLIGLRRDQGLNGNPIDCLQGDSVFSHPDPISVLFMGEDAFFPIQRYD